MSKMAALYAEFIAEKNPEIKKQLGFKIRQLMNEDRENMNELLARHEEVFGK